MEEKKLCPFRKETVMTNYKNNGVGYPVDTQYEETFLPCLGTKCAAYWTDVTMVDGCNVPRQEYGCKLLERKF